MDKYVPLHKNLLATALSPQLHPDAEQPMMTDTSGDKIANYSHQIIELGLVLMQLIDTTREGDGEGNVCN